MKSLTMSNERGSALLVSLMVMVGLSLLGLAFVSISETETAISMNHKNATQVQTVSETGTKFVIDWFQDPNWAEDNDFLPANDDAIKPERTIGGTTDRYKSNAGEILLDTPFRPARNDRFYGTENAPDILINNDTDQDFLDDLNAALFQNPAETGRITEIRIYAPPMLTGTVNADGYWEDATRLGMSTVQVTAVKCRNDTAADPCDSNDAADRLVAQKTTRAVLSEWPFPGPSGPVQTNADLNTNGALKVHWGRITATGIMDLKRPFAGLPFHDAYNRVRFEFGYVDPAVGVANNPWPTQPASGDFRVKYDWINDLVEKQLYDPWYEAWGRSDYEGDGTGGPFQVSKYNDPAISIGDIGGGSKDCGICRTIFQFQTQNQPDELKDVLFPRIDYDFWKDIAIAGDDQDTIFYLQYDAATEGFRDRNGTVKSFLDWVDTTQDAVAGFYFFDTVNGLNPQNGGPGILTPLIKVSAWTGQMQGFIYSNSEIWDGTAVHGQDGRFNMPGEPYRDIGYWQVNDAGTDWEDDGAGGKVIDGADTGGWNYQDINDNDEFDYVMVERNIARASGGNIDAWFLAPWVPGCTVDTDCSEPHEPYLNYVYPADADSNVTIGWEAGEGTRRPKQTDDGTATGAAIACGMGSTVDECTSNGYDRDGAVVELEVGLNGVFYIEGDWEQTGNGMFFGSVLVQGDASKAGTPDVWFDERLIKGDWPPAEFRFPRAYVSSLQTD